MSSRARVAFFVEDDKTFLLPAVERTIALLGERGFETVQVGVVPPRLGRRQGLAVPLWLAQVFGFRNAALLGMYAALEAFRRIRAHFGGARRCLSWGELAGKFGLQVRRLSDPNSASAREFLLSGKCEIQFILIPYVLRTEILEAPRLGVINKHAAILPGCRGLFPFLWCTIHSLPIGITFHKVTAEVDAGPVLVRHRFEGPLIPRTMLEFYIRVFRLYPVMAVAAAERLLEGGGEPQAGPGSRYFGLPSRSDYKKFRAAGGRIVRLADLRESVALD